jgi:hypothetical protein
MDSITSSTGLAPLERSLSGKILVVGIFLPHGYEALITEVVEVFEHQQDSHLSEGITRQAYTCMERSEGFL